MEAPDSFAALIACWPSIVALSDDLDVPYPTAAAMKLRGSIGIEHWPALIQKAADRQIPGVTLEHLATLAAQERKAKAKARAL